MYKSVTSFVRKLSVLFVGHSSVIPDVVMIKPIEYYHLTFLQHFIQQQSARHAATVLNNLVFVNQKHADHSGTRLLMTLSASYHISRSKFLPCP